MLTQAELDRFWTKGWLVVNDVFTADQADHIRAVAMQVSEAEMPKGKAGYQVDRSASGEAAPRKIDKPYTKSGEFRQFIGSQRMTDLLQQILQEKPLLCTDQIFMKPPHFGSAKPYHQDNFYFACSPADKVLTAWVALDDVDEENGCLRYIDGSHRDGLLPHEPVPDEPHNLAPKPELIDLTRESLALVRKGGVVIHHSMTLHTSHRNESSRWRRAYASHWVTASVSSTAKTIEHAYFNNQALQQAGA